MENFTIVRNALSLPTCLLIDTTLKMLKDTHYIIRKIDPDNKHYFAEPGVPVNCWAAYAPMITEGLLLQMQPQIEEIVGEALFPTYSYARIYWNGAYMKKHTDRPQCEVSVSLTISADTTPWPLIFNGHELDINPGDMVVYKGTELSHWRAKYRGTEQTQVMLHYVFQNGLSRNLKFDGREAIGMSRL